MLGRKRRGGRGCGCGRILGEGGEGVEGDVWGRVLELIIFLFRWHDIYFDFITIDLFAPFQ